MLRRAAAAAAARCCVGSGALARRLACTAAGPGPGAPPEGRGAAGAGAPAAAAAAAAAPPRFRREVRVPVASLASLVGVRRRNLNRIERRAGAAVAVEPPPPPAKKSRGKRGRPTTRGVRLTADTRAALDAAEVLVHGRVARYAGSETVWLPVAHVRRLHPKMLLELERVVGVRADAPARGRDAEVEDDRGRPRRPLTLHGRRKDVARAKKLITQRLGLWPGTLEWQQPAQSDDEVDHEVDKAARREVYLREEARRRLIEERKAGVTQKENVAPVAPSLKDKYFKFLTLREPPDDATGGMNKAADADEEACCEER